MPPFPSGAEAAPASAAWDRIVCVDWAKDRPKRAAWVAEVRAASVSPLQVEPTLRSLIAHAQQLPGRTLIGIDAAIGIPKSYLAAGKSAVPAWGEAQTFPDWLVLAAAGERFPLGTTDPSEWRHEQPFIAVPGGAGSLGAFWTKAGGVLRRQVDLATGGNSPFVVSGIPGSVGSGSRALWLELVELLAEQRSFGLWPFDSARELAAARVVVGEIYPRACYATALSAVLPAPARAIGKTKHDRRGAAVDELMSAPWLSELHVKIDAQGLARARVDEDHFDAMISAAALLRCVLEGRSLDDPSADPVEGGILGICAIMSRAARASKHPRTARSRTPGLAGPVARSCPIDGCSHLFRGSRGGWDTHVGSQRIHPSWHPTVSDREERLALFRREFRAWLE